MTRPRIGITRGGSAERISASYQSYHARIREAGGEPIDLWPSIGSPIEELLASLDGLLLSGGPDVAPHRYHAEPDPDLGSVDEPRDALELELIERALARDLPVLAICRGHQVLNVACGGGLVQHIPGNSHRALDDGRGDSQFHDVIVASGSALAGLIGAGRVRTNSRHHQAVQARSVGAGLVTTALAEDGTIEGLESPTHRWVLAVQWHPERDEVADQFRPLFEAFVAASARVPASAGA